MCPEWTPCSAMVTRDAHPAADALVAAARALTGCRFRPQGRGRDGLDCVGLVWLAAHGAGLGLRMPPAFPMRGTAITFARTALLEAGLAPLGSTGLARPGDVLLAAPAVLQVHLAIRTDVGVLEAHAGVRRVTERPLWPGECWDSAWRLPMEGN